MHRDLKSIVNKLALCIFTMLFAISCSSSDTPPPRTETKQTDNEVNPVPVLPPTHSKSSPFSLAEIPTASQDETIAFFKESCASCHDAKSGPMSSFFAIDTQRFHPNDVATSSRGKRVYYSLFKKAFDIQSGSPAPMPTRSLDDAGKLRVKKVLKWFEMNKPDLVMASAKEFSFYSDLSDLSVITTFRCSNLLSSREYLNRVTADAFDRLPTSTEQALLGDRLDKAISSTDRKAIAQRIFSDPNWKADFRDNGLKKFAQKLSGASLIGPYPSKISEMQANDLKLEFYELLKRDFDTKSYRDILMTESIPVSQHTAAFYGCSHTGAGWSNCTLPLDRRSYFATMSYLRSTPSSFLADNNNYKRVATMQFVIQGDVLLAATDGPKGDSPASLPQCLQTKDQRSITQSGSASAPFGTEAVPMTGNLCQSCHIDRYLASGSMIYRQFNSWGGVFNSSLAGPISADFDFSDATAIQKVTTRTGTTRVSESFLNLLLTDPQETACIKQPDGNYRQVKYVHELTDALIGDGQVLSVGLAKHLPRAMSNVSFTTEEILKSVENAYSKSGGKLGPVFEAYFSSETFSCKREDIAGEIK
jgi:hypothetical protein